MWASFQVFPKFWRGQTVPLAVFLRNNFNCSAGLAQWHSLAQTEMSTENMSIFAHIWVHRIENLNNKTWYYSLTYILPWAYPLLRCSRTILHQGHTEIMKFRQSVNQRTFSKAESTLLNTNFIIIQAHFLKNYPVPTNFH